MVSLADARGKLPMDKLLDMQLRSGVSFDHLASVYEEYTGKIAVENLRPSWLIFSDGFQQDAAPARRPSARSTSSASVIGLVVGAPIMPLVGGRVEADLARAGAVSPGARRTATARTFTVHKFRIDARRRRSGDRRRSGRSRTIRASPARPLPAPHPARRAAAAVERSAAAT